MDSNLCWVCNHIFEGEQTLREDRPHHQSRDGILEAARAGCRLCSFITNSLAFELFAGKQPFKAVWYLSYPKASTTKKPTARLTIDAGWDEEDDVSESSLASSSSLDCKNVDTQGYVKLPQTGTEMKGPSKSGFAPIWGFQMFPISEVRSSASSSESPIQLGNSRSWTPVHRWLTDCLENHERCVKNINTAYRPTRLVEILNKTTVRVVEHPDKDSCLSYASFSHCWGQAKTLKLLKENKKQLQTGIEIATLPASYKEALNVLKGFNISFIWIDSLCIIQNSTDDWRAEAATMCDVYRNAVLNISACAAAENSELSFKRRNLNTVQPIRITPSWRGIRNESFFVTNADVWEQEVEESPLYRRSWVLQEARLSTRNLCLTSNQLWWGCRGGTCCETWPEGLPDDVDRAKLREKSSASPETYDHFTWCDLIEKYTTCGLTVLSDRMIAIAGLATAYHQGFPGDEYIAGMWRSQLPQSLCWVAGPDEMVPMKYRTTQYRAPSWSWVSVEGGVYFQHTRHGIDGVRPISVCDLLGVDLSRIAPFPYTELAGGCLQLRAPVAEVEVDDGALRFQGGDRECHYIPGTAEDVGREAWNFDQFTSVVLDEYTSYTEAMISHISTSTIGSINGAHLTGTKRISKLAGRWEKSEGRLFCAPIIEWDHPDGWEGAGIILIFPKLEPPGRCQRVGSFRWKGNLVRDHLRGLGPKELSII
ncbi:heterokaryon incompatibility protein-domain-containing protein [Colletotrichum cereale]|nr:heterokaryon incompatibility protein-domain-containing protein [Colletotrichum cereale]